MKLILSPTKTMDMGEPDLGGLSPGHPEFAKDAERLVRMLTTMDRAGLKKVFKTSDSLTLKVQEMIEGFDRAPASPALFAFRGEAFKTLAPDDFTREQMRYAQENLRILSGLYGALCPLDLIKPYRLDFNTPLKPGGTGMKPFWKKRLIPWFESLLAPGEWLINLASDEYASVLNSEKLKQRTITLQFREANEGQLKNVTVRAKQARGCVARHIIKKALADPAPLKQASIAGYTYSRTHSSEQEWFFIR
ncbi:MAG: YaaA family protein [Desulfobacter sp.]|nr:MAG: YaaA family protein [Desulfobacter sp.]